MRRTRGPRYTPVSKRQDKPDGIAWIIRNHPEVSDGQISKLIGTTRTTIAAIRERSHWNMANIQPKDPVTLGLTSQRELDAAIAKAAKAAGTPAYVDTTPRQRPAGADRRAARRARPARARRRSGAGRGRSRRSGEGELAADEIVPGIRDPFKRQSSANLIRPVHGGQCCRHGRRRNRRRPVSELSFEAALARLEEIVRLLERGEAPLDQSIELYQEGDRLKRHCEARLKAAQARIEQIAFGADGKPAGVTPFDGG